VILLLIYVNSRQRAKNKELLFEREQQQYNEDMFLMTLDQKSNWEKGRSEERQRISQELHDDIVSRLFTLRFRWNALKLIGEAEITALHREYLRLLEALETDIRNLSHELRNVLYDEAEDFKDALEGIVKNKSEIANFTYNFQCKNPEDLEGLTYIAKINLRRLFEEVLQNVVKHAKASSVNIFLYRDGDLLHISIADNGKGFSPLQVKKGIGIKNLENRTRKLNGSFAIHSTLDVGTIVSIRIPIKPNEL
jgi:signal transduction histidine kinase